MKKYLVPAAMMLSSSLTVVGTAYAASANSTLNVSATITSDCAVSTVAVDFGNVVAGSGAAASGSVDVNCTLATPYTIALDAGANYVAPDRQITDGTNVLAYTLTDNVSGLAWGDDGTTIADASVADTGTGTLQSHVVDANLIGANVPSGAYSDTVNVTVTY